MCASGRMVTPRRIERQQEVGDAPVARLGLRSGAGEQDGVRRDVRAARPDLLAVDAPSALDARRCRAQRCEV